jgi:hypothetical protein
MLVVDNAAATGDLADRAARIVRQHPYRTPERRAAAMTWAAIVTTRTTSAARRALGTFGDPAARPAALVLLGQLTEADARAAPDPELTRTHMGVTS